MEGRFFKINIYCIFSFFLSGWGIQDACQYYDIFDQLVTVSYVTNRITNPYHDKGVNEEVKKNSYYVGPVVVMQKFRKNRKCVK